jgi:hypothetical protein
VCKEAEARENQPLKLLELTLSRARRQAISQALKGLITTGVVVQFHQLFFQQSRARTYGLMRFG